MDNGNLNEYGNGSGGCLCDTGFAFGCADISSVEDGKHEYNVKINGVFSRFDFYDDFLFHAVEPVHDTAENSTNAGRGFYGIH